MWILIRWFRQKQTDLYPKCFQQRINLGMCFKTATCLNFHELVTKFLLVLNSLSTYRKYCAVVKITCSNRLSAIFRQVSEEIKLP